MSQALLCSPTIGAWTTACAFAARSSFSWFAVSPTVETLDWSPLLVQNRRLQFLYAVPSSELISVSRLVVRTPVAQQRQASVPLVQMLPLLRYVAKTCANLRQENLPQGFPFDDWSHEDDRSLHRWPFGRLWVRLVPPISAAVD